MAGATTVRIGIELPIRNHDAVFVSTDDVGTPGALNVHVLEQLGLGKSVLSDQREVLREHGYAVFEHGQTLVVFIVTVSLAPTAVSLTQNLQSALKSIAVRSEGRSVNRVWLPLMGTGAGRMEFAESARLSVSGLIQAFYEFGLRFDQLDLSVGRPADGRTLDDLTAVLTHQVRESGLDWKIEAVSLSP
ncbi:MAG: hypothetical protein FJX02_09330 [Alphaproteobacteria bacterium]|nr:hypothetical protein [Alphaproteobacteria bacterium]